MTATILAPTEGSIHSLPRPFELPAHELQDLQLAPPIDRDQLLEQCLDNLDFALTLLGELERTSQSRLNDFDVALAEHDHAAIATKAHALRGVAGILAANKLMQTCSTLESAARNSDWNQIAALVAQLHHEMQRTIDFTSRIRAER